MNLGKFKLYRKLASLKMYLQPNIKKAIKIGYFNSLNFGDALNPIILKLLGIESVNIYYNPPKKIIITY